MNPLHKRYYQLHRRETIAYRRWQRDTTNEEMLNAYLAAHELSFQAFSMILESERLEKSIAA